MRYLLLLALTLPACDDDAEAPTATWQSTLRPIVEAECVSCHQPGGIGPFSMVYDPGEWADGAPHWATAAVDAVEAGRMPPWSPDTDCREYRGQRVLTAEEREAFTAWRAAGFAEGDPASFVAQQPQTVDLGPPDLELVATADYVPDVTRPDDYRCLPLPQTFEADTWVNGTDFAPDRAEMVHHVVVFVIPPEDARTLEELDAAEDGPGYTCFGDSGIDRAKFLAVWAPGVQPSETPPGSALLVPAGGRLVMQMHYNVLNLAGAEPPPDRTAVRLWTLPAGETPQHRITLIPHADLFIEIPAGESDITSERLFRVTEAAEIVGVAPHEHLLGASIRADLVREGEPDACLVDIPDWDFNWQDMYYFRPDQALPVQPGDQVRLTCRFDNSAEVQPVFNGERMTPRDVAWGDGSTDEMCLNFLIVRTPYEAPYNQCAFVPECESDCAPGDSDCWLACLIEGGADCAACTVPNWIGCAAGPCGDEVNALLECVGDGCASGICLLHECADLTGQLHACSAEHLRAGNCNAGFRGCGFEL